MKKIEVHLNDGSTSVPECVVMLPANEANELDTVLLLGEVVGGIRCKDYDLILMSLSCFVFHLSDFGICFDKYKHQIEQNKSVGNRLNHFLISLATDSLTQFGRPRSRWWASWASLVLRER